MTITLQWGSPNAETTLLPQAFRATRGTAIDFVFGRQSSSSRSLVGADVKIRFSASRNDRTSLEIDANVSGTTFTAAMTPVESGGLVARKWYFQAFDLEEDELLSHGVMDLWNNPDLVDEGGIPLVTAVGPTGATGGIGPTGPPGPVGPGGGDAVTSLGLGQFALTSSAELFGVLSDETGSGVGAKAVFNLQPRFITDIAPVSNNGATLGTVTLGWGTLHVATNWTLNAANGNAVVTHSTGAFTVTTGDFRIQVAGTNPLSCATLEGTQTFKNKTYHNPTFTGTFAIPSGAYAPLIIGGDLAGSSITIQTTSNGSPVSGADIIFRSSTTEFGRFLNSGVLQVAGSITTVTAAPGTNNNNAATTAFVQAAVAAGQAGLDTKLSCRVATTANITLSGAQTIDGVAVVAGNRVLVKDQSTAANNGIYVAAAGAWARASDADADAEVTSGLFTFIEEGTLGGSGWVLTTDDPIVLGTTALTFTQFTGGTSYVEGVGIDITGQTISVDQAFSPNWTGNHSFANIITGSITGNAATATSVAVGGITGLGTGVATALAINVGSAGAFVTFNGNAGTPSAIVLTNATGTAAGLTAGTATAVAVGGITGLGTGVATALAVNVGSAGAFVVFNGSLGTPSSGVGTNLTGTAAGLTAGAATVLATSRNIWGQVFTGDADVSGSLTGVDDITGGASDMVITAGTGNSRTMALRTTTAGGVATTALSLDASQNAAFANDVAITGNLTVNGTVVTINTDNITVEDSLIKQAVGNAADTLDIGFYGQYVSSGTKYTGFFRDASDGKYRLFTGLTVEPTTTVDTGGSGYAVGTLVGNLEGNVTNGSTSIANSGIVTSDLTVNDDFIVDNSGKSIKLGTLNDTIFLRTGPGKLAVGAVAAGKAIPLSSNGANIVFTGLTADRTYTLPDADTTLGGAGSATASFVAHKNGTDQTGVAVNTATKVTFTTEVFDVGSYYDSTNSKWTPPAGKVLIAATVYFTSANPAAASALIVSVYKNGSELISQFGRYSANDDEGISFSIIDTANGTDYYEIYTLSGGSGTKTIGGSTTRTRFQGSMI